MEKHTFLVLDFGSQLTQLIARRLRELGYYSEIHPYNLSLEKIKALKPVGIILSGGPNSVYEEGAPYRPVKELLDLAPLLGICYGMQLIAKDLGGVVEKSSHREYGFNRIQWSQSAGLQETSQKVWMSHGDIVRQPPAGCQVIATSEGNHPAAMKGERILSLQFHPEVAHTEQGEKILQYYAQNMCRVEPDWRAPQIAELLQEQVRQKAGATDHVLVGLSGGVDSSVVATLLTRALGPERVHCVFVNNGLLRQNEFRDVMAQYEKIGLNVKGVDATGEFLTALKGLSDPEQKRKAIGRVFIEIFEKSMDPQWPIKWLAQGTLYPDVIESVSFHGGPSQTIKSHHNVGGLPEKMKLGLIEPVRELFKDEVRRVGAELGLPAEMLGRHPFPGPGLAIRIMGEVTEPDLQVLREADHIFISHLREKKLYDKIWQAFCVLLPVKTVGVQGDGRTYDKVLALRAVTSSDGMTADWYPFEFEFMRDVSNEITNKVHGVNRVVYDVTSKPPGTIEWE
ncbi:MAG: glutamine-hydrolyzing GMP synthase [Bdellovibrio sp. CG10_big_fil_rev_8_21_14_0_10_47_8]|nr:MAG: glutamine-hydrolyzing GMP synthase [Bdellovibrio sp. CG10_big_fil_rev_8_21_14_0_10_47_8]